MPTDPTFRMTVEDVFTIRGRGTIVTGQIESGTLNVGDEVQIVGPAVAGKTVVTSIETFRKQIHRAGPGDNVGLLLRNVGKDDVQRGDVLQGTEYDFTWKV